MEWVPIAEQQQTLQHQVQCQAADEVAQTITTGLWSIGESHLSVWQSGFCKFLEKFTCMTALCQLLNLVDEG